MGESIPAAAVHTRPVASVTDRGTRSATHADDGDRALMLQAYTRCGGLEQGDVVAMRMRDHIAQPISVLARWIVLRHMIVVAWRARPLIPMFQFAPHDMSLRAEVSATIALLAPALDDWHLALWFVRTNALLDGATPIDAIERDPKQVLRAASTLRSAAQH